MDKKDYVTVRVGKPGHRAEIREHRLLAEQALGHSLPKGAEVHHVNGDKHKNLANLVICQDRAFHLLLEAKMRRLRKTGSLDLKQCNKCKEIKPLADFHNCKTWWDGKAAQCRVCANAASREYRRSR